MSGQIPDPAVVMQFAEIIGLTRFRRHIGCVLAAGPDWIEVSIPKGEEPGQGLRLRLPPSRYQYRVRVDWWTPDRLGMVYVGDRPARAEIAAALFTQVSSPSRQLTQNLARTTNSSSPEDMWGGTGTHRGHKA